MKCEEIEKRLFLYKELTDRERQETDRHLSQCSSCSAIMEQVNTMHRVIASQRDKIQPMRNAAQMTHRIMDAVKNTGNKKINMWEVLHQRISLAPLRYGMTALSLFLLIFFLGEYANDGRNLRISKIHPGNPAKKTELNLASFHSAFLAARESNISSSKLISACVENCLQSQLPECNECSGKFTKPKSNI